MSSDEAYYGRRHYFPRDIYRPRRRHSDTTYIVRESHSPFSIGCCVRRLRTSLDSLKAEAKKLIDVAAGFPALITDLNSAITTLQGNNVDGAIAQLQALAAKMTATRTFFDERIKSTKSAGEISYVPYDQAYAGGHGLSTAFDGMETAFTEMAGMYDRMKHTLHHIAETAGLAVQGQGGPSVPYESEAYYPEGPSDGYYPEYA
jgi:hypothetical protein